jgi:EspG family
MSTELSAGPAPSTDWSRAARLRPVEFQACWAALGLGDTPLALDLRPTGATIAERDRIHRDALVELTRRGLADHAGPCLPLAGALRLVATAPYLCDLRLTGSTNRSTDGAAELVAVGAAAREYGVVVALSGGELTVLPVSGPRVPITLVELIGPLTPARTRPVNIPAELLDQACQSVPDGDLWALADRLVEFGVLPADASSVARMCTGITAAGQLGATGRGGAGGRGRERRGRWVVGFHRGEAGDCLQLRRRCGPERETVSIAPIDAQKLLAQLGELIDDVRRA